MIVQIKASPEYIPTRATDGASGYDIRATTGCVIPPGEQAKIATGIELAVPFGYECQVRPRSGLAVKHGVVATFGTVDSDYRGEIAVLLVNFGRTEFYVKPGDRVAQIVFQKVEHPSFDIVDVLTPTIRGAKGFGHTGV